MHPIRIHQFSLILTTTVLWLTLGIHLSNAANTPVTGDWLVKHSLSDPDSLNPFTSQGYESALIKGLIFERMLRRHPQTLELMPYIAAERPKISQDKLTYTFTLRHDVTFQDGVPLTAHDVLFSLKTVKNPWVNAPFQRVYYQSIVNAVLLDNWTIRVTAKEPYFRNELILGSLTIIPRHYYDPNRDLDALSITQLDRAVPKRDADATLMQPAQRFAQRFNKTFSRRPMGSGPYKFLGWRTGQEIILERNQTYWGMGKPGINQPYLNRQIRRVFNNIDAALVALKSGDLDAIDRLKPIQHLRQTHSKRFSKRFNKHVFFTPSYTYIGWNNDHPIFRDKRVRQAMTHMTNRQLMVKTILLGLGEVVDSPVYLFRPEYDKALYSHPYDPQKARQLLSRAGWRDSDDDGIIDNIIDGKRIPFQFEIKFNSGNDIRKSVALTLQDELKKHGIDVSIRQVDWTIYLDNVRNHQFDAMILGWAMPIDEPDGYQVWHSSQAANKGSNAVSFKNQRADALLEENRRTFDTAKRIDIYQEFQQILNVEQPYTFLFIRKSILAVHKRLRNIRLYPERPRPLEWWVPLAEQKFTTSLSTQ